MNTDNNSGAFDPKIGRDSEIHAIAASDSTPEELLASGADVTMLVEAGVLEDDYNPDERSFPVVTEKDLQLKHGPKLSEDQFEEWLSYWD